MKLVWRGRDIVRLGAILKSLDKRPVFYGVTVGWTGVGVVRLVGGCECGHERGEHDWGEDGEMSGECQSGRCPCRRYRKAEALVGLPAERLAHACPECNGCVNLDTMICDKCGEALVGLPDA